MKSTAAAPSSCVRTPSVSCSRARREVRERERRLDAPAGAGRAPERERRRRRRRSRPRRPHRRRRARCPAIVTGSPVEPLRRADQQAVERARTERRPRLREQRRGAGDGRGGGARAVDGDEARRAVRVHARVGGREADARRDEVGLHAPVEREAGGGEARDAAVFRRSDAARRLASATATGWPAADARRARRARRSAAARRRGRAIDSSRPSPPAGSGACRRRAGRPTRRPRAARAAAGAGDAPIGTSAARPATRLTPGAAEEVGEPRRGAARAAERAARDGDLEVEPAASGARRPTIGAVPSSSVVEPGAHDDARAVGLRARVDRADGERRGRAAGPGDVAVARRPPRPSLPAGATTSVSSASAPAAARASGSRRTTTSP